MEFARLAAAFQDLEGTSKRLEMTQRLMELIREVPKGFLDKAILMLQGKLYPDFVGIELGVAEKLTIKAISRSFGVPEPEIVGLQKKHGDIGTAAEEVARRRRQRSMGSDPLTVEGVYSAFERIAKSQGTGSQDQKVAGLMQLLQAASPLEARYVVRLATGKLRLGVADQTAVEALAALLTDGRAVSVTELDPAQREAREETKSAVQRALDVTSDLGLVARTAMESGLGAVKRLRLKLGVPLRPMLAERAETLEEALGRMPGRAFVEFKYDGLRMQVHAGKEVRIFSRRLEDLTAQFPDVVKSLAHAFGGKQVVCEGEAVAIDPKTGRIRPFQELSQRRGRKYGLGSTEAPLFEGGVERDITKEIPVRLFLFDLLWLEGEDWTQRPLEERRGALAKLLRQGEAVQMGAMQEMRDVKALEEYFQSVTELGAEGIMIKNPESAYEAGGRGYNWIKFKADYQKGLADSFDLVAIGAYWGQGRRGGWYGALLLASFNESTGRFESLCRLATGFDDATLAALEKRFAPHLATSKPPLVDSTLEPDLWIEPRVVLEVEGAELTISPNHRCAWGEVKEEAGLSVRFPRFTGRWRDDKRPEQATTSKEVLKMFRARRKKQGS